MNTLISKGKEFLQKPRFLALLCFVLGIIVSSIFWQLKIETDLKNTSKNNMAPILTQEQKQSPQPSQTPNIIDLQDKYVKAENLTNNTYNLECFDTEKNYPSWVWLNNLEKQLATKEKIAYICFNSSLNQATFISQIMESENEKSPEFSIIYRIQLFDINNNSLSFLTDNSGSNLWGCKQITTWTKTNNLYYECGVSNKPSETKTFYKINLENKIREIIKSCSDYRGKVICLNYCAVDNNCNQGTFCNQEESRCIQKCETDNDCGAGYCINFGSTKGCGNTSLY